MIGISALPTLLLLASGQDAVPTEIAKAAILSLMARHRSGARAALCLVVDGGDPSEELSAFLQSHSLEILPGSKCHYEETSPRHTVVRTSEGIPGEFLVLDGFKRAGPEKVQVDYMFRAGSWTGHGSTLDLEYQQGEWHQVSSSQYEWVE